MIRKVFQKSKIVNNSRTNDLIVRVVVQPRIKQQLFLLQMSTLNAINHDDDDASNVTDIKATGSSTGAPRMYLSLLDDNVLEKIFRNQIKW